MAVTLPIRQGATFAFVFRWETTPIVYKPITAIVKQAPVRITATAHGLPADWRVAVVSVLGMTELNAESAPPRASQYHAATVVDVNTVELNDVNAAEYGTYVSGGYLQYNTPVDLAGYTARLKVRTKVGGTELLSLVSPTELAINNTTKTITVNITAAATELLTFTRGVYDLEMVSSGSVVTSIAQGPVTVTKEVTST